MGFMDRQYYRDASQQMRWPGATSSGVKLLLAINFACFVVQLITSSGRDSGWFTELFSMNSQKVFGEGQVWRLVTGAFLHGGPWHIIVNMVVLYFFGTDLEAMYGRKEFLTFYFVAAVLASLAFALTYNIAHRADAPRPGGADMVGASGPVLAVAVLCACHFPYRTILLFFIFPMPLWLVVSLYVIADAIVFLQGTGSGVAVAAHLGGAAFGFLYFKFTLRLVDIWSRTLGFFRPRTRRNSASLRLYRPPSHEEEIRPEPVATRQPALGELLETEVDAILAKLAEHNMDMTKLSDDERETLSRASEMLRRRRQ